MFLTADIFVTGNEVRFGPKADMAARLRALSWDVRAAAGCAPFGEIINVTRRSALKHPLRLAAPASRHS